jgi:hypothetical protein
MFKTINNDMKKEDPRIVRTRWMNKDANTILLTIPHQFRKRFQLDQPTNVLMIPTDNGILIKKLETEVII